MKDATVRITLEGSDYDDTTNTGDDGTTTNKDKKFEFGSKVTITVTNTGYYANKKEYDFKDSDVAEQELTIKLTKEGKGIFIPIAKSLFHFWNHLFLDYGEITSCKKQDMNLGWTSFIFKAAPMPNEAVCKLACSTNDQCDFYTFIDSITFPQPNCYCGEYKVPPVQVPVASVSEVTLKYKKGEKYFKM